jgi:hypothetical protein
MTMNARGLTRNPILIMLTACAVILLLTACQPAAPTPSAPPEQPTTVTAPTSEPAAPPTDEPAAPLTGELSLELSGIAQDQTVETILAVSAGEGGPYWEIAPQHRRVTLQGYPVSSHLHKPIILVYPVEDMAESNETAGRMEMDLQALLDTRQDAERMPFLPLFNAAQVLHVQVEYLDFINGQGVRYLTQFDQAPVPVNNYELLYTYQGLTSDGKFYVAAVLPVTHPDLPDSPIVSEEQFAEMEDFATYMAETVEWLKQQPTSSFTPDLAKLDAMMQSIEVK